MRASSLAPERPEEPLLTLLLCNQPVVMRDLYSTTGGLAEQEDFQKQNFAPKFEVYKEIGRGSPVL